MNQGPTMPPPPDGNRIEAAPPPPPAHPQSADSTGAGASKPWWKRWWGIALLAMGGLVVVSIISGPDTATTDDDPIAADEPESVETADDRENADEQAAAGTPAEDDAGDAADEPVDEPEPQPEPEPEPFEPVVISGTGDDVIDVPTFEMPMVAAWQHDGGANFAVWAYDDAGGRDLMVNTIGAYSGTRPLNFMGDVVEFEITASGPWTVTITPLLDQPTLTGTPVGSGDQVLFADASGRLALTHDGDQNFAVWAYGDRRALLVNEIGAYRGTVRLPDAVAIEIVADGNWTLELN